MTCHPHRVWVLSTILSLVAGLILGGCGEDSSPPSAPGEPTPGSRPLAFVTLTADGSHIAVIDATTHSMITGIPNAVEKEPRGIGASPDGRFVAWVNWETNDLDLYDVRADSIVATLPLGETRGRNVVFTPDGRFAYVASERSDEVTVIQTEPPSVAKTLTVGRRPASVTMSPDGAHVYVPNMASGDVSVIETATNSVVETIPVGNAPAVVPASSPAFTPDGRFLYVANWGSGDVSVIETATNSVVETIPVGEGPGAVELSADGARLYVLNSEGRSVSIIDVGTNQVTRTLPLRMEDPQHLEVRPDGKFIYVGERLTAGGNLKVIDAGSGSVQTLHVGDNIDDLEISPDGDFLYVTLTDSDEVAVVETATNSVVRKIQTGKNPSFIAFTPSRSGIGRTARPPSGTFSRQPFGTTGDPGVSDTLAFAALTDDDAVAVIDLGKPSRLDTVPVGHRPRKLAVSPGGKFVYAACRGGVMSVIDVARLQVIDSLRVDRFPSDVIVHPRGSFIYVSDALADEVTVIDAAGNAVATRITVGKEPFDLEMTPDGERLFVMNHLGGSVSVIETATHEVEEVIPVGDSPLEAIISADGSFLYLTSAGTGDLLAIDVNGDSVAGTVPLGGRPTRALAAGADGDFLYVGVQADGKAPDHLAVVDVADMKVVARKVMEQGAPEVIRATPEGDYLYVASRNGQRLSIWEASDSASGLGKVVRILPGSPRTLAVSPGGRFVLSSDRIAAGVGIVDVDSRSYVSQVETGIVWDVAFAPPSSAPPSSVIAGRGNAAPSARSVPGESASGVHSRLHF